MSRQTSPTMQQERKTVCLISPLRELLPLLASANSVSSDPLLLSIRGVREDSKCPPSDALSLSWVGAKVTGEPSSFGLRLKLVE